MSEESIEDRLGEAAVRAADAVVPEIIQRLRRDAPAMIAAEREVQRGFEERLAMRWQEPFELYQMVLTSAREMVADFDQENREEAVQKQDFIFEVLHRLAIRSCRVAAEVLCLLRGGFADGAHARWRTLHELAATAFFVRKARIDTAERYLLYEHIEAYKAASQLQDHASKLNAQQFSDAGMEVLKKNRDILVAKYGKEFAGEYGWAFEALKRLDSAFNGRIKFDAIERCAAIGHMRPYYKMASNQVHAGPKGAAFTLGSIGRKKINLVGASNAGLADPGQGTVLSLVQVLVTLLLHKPENIERFVGIRVLQSLVTDTAQSFVAVQRKLKEEQREIESDENG